MSSTANSNTIIKMSSGKEDIGAAALRRERTLCNAVTRSFSWTNNSARFSAVILG